MSDSLIDALGAARRAGRRVLFEDEGLTLARALGMCVPAHLVVANADHALHVVSGALPGERVVVKVRSSVVTHKTDVHGVVVVPNTPHAIADAVAHLQRTLALHDIEGFLVEEYVPHELDLGSELLIGARWTPDFGAVVTVGAGGIHSEFLATRFVAKAGAAIVEAANADHADALRALHDAAAVQLVVDSQRGDAPRLAFEQLATVVRRLGALAHATMPHDLAELEFNPVAVTPDGLVALDARARLGDGHRPAVADRPVAKLRNLLQPERIAILGVSERGNPGRAILQNVLRQGFPAEHIAVVKPNVATIDGCAAYPNLAALPHRVDLLVVAVDAAQVPAILREAIARDCAASIVLIPGGLGERPGSEHHVQAMRDALRIARATPGGGPLIHGGNCLGVRSRPGGYDTLFIPAHKLAFRGGEPDPIAFVSQSGAFAVARASDLGGIEPRYVITVGNQFDVTLGDYLTHLADDPAIAVFACYVEGFQPLDGQRFVAAARRITASGRAVVVYRAGRTTAGRDASATHTASIAGDAAVGRALLQAAGVLVADTLEEFDDLVRLALLLRDKRVDGRRLGAVSNAGFECVAIADNLHGFTLAEFGAETKRRLASLLDDLRLDGIVGVTNPLDLTPIAPDAAYEIAASAILEAHEVDVGVVGCVPLTGALHTLDDPAHGERLDDPHAITVRLGHVAATTDKAWVAVVDGGAAYDPMVARLRAAGIPTFRRADRALTVFARYCAWRIGREDETVP